MIDVPALRDRLKGGDWVVFDLAGKRRDIAVPSDAGPATLLVSEPADAVKVVGVDGLVEGSVDRAGLWAVEAVILNRIVLERLDCGAVSPEQLLEEVAATGIGWQAVPFKP